MIDSDSFSLNFCIYIFLYSFSLALPNVLHITIWKKGNLDTGYYFYNLV